MFYKPINVLYMKKFILLLCAILALGVGVMKAQDSFTITFNATAKGGSSLSTSTQATTFVASEARKYVETKPVAAATNSYYGGTSTNDAKYIRIGKSKAAGNVTLKLAAEYNVMATTVVVSAKKYGSSDENATLTLNGQNVTITSTDFEDKTFTFDGDVKVSQLAFSINTPSTNKSNRVYIQSITVSSKKIDTSKTTPQLSFAETEVVEEFVEGKTLAVQVPTSDTEGLSYTYQSSDPAVATVEGETITLVGPGTTTITVTSADTETLNSATASYTLNVEMVYNSLADLFKYAKDGDLVDINFPMTIGYAGTQKQNFYVTDGTAYVLIYDKGGNHNLTYEDGDIIPGGWSAECEIYGGLPELLVNSDMPAATEKGTYEIETINAADWTTQPLNKIVIVDNVEFTAATPAGKSKFTGTSGETEITFYNNFALPAEEAGTYKVTAIVSHYTKDMTTIATEANQLAPISFSIQPTEATVTPAPDANGEIKVKAGDKITFTVPNAAKLEVEIITDEPSAESAPILKATSNQTVEGDTYTYTVPAEVVPTMITVTPINAEGEKLTKLATTVMLVNADTTGVIDVTVAGEGEVEYFNLQGVRVANPESGLYIRRQGNQVSKIYLR